MSRLLACDLDHVPDSFWLNDVAPSNWCEVWVCGVSVVVVVVMVVVVLAVLVVVVMVVLVLVVTELVHYIPSTPSTRHCQHSIWSSPWTRVGVGVGYPLACGSG